MLETIKEFCARLHPAHEQLDEARRAFRTGHITEFRFRGILAARGYTRYGIDEEVRDQLLLMSAP